LSSQSVLPSNSQTSSTSLSSQSVLASSSHTSSVPLLSQSLPANSQLSSVPLLSQSRPANSQLVEHVVIVAIGRAAQFALVPAWCLLLQSVLVPPVMSSASSTPLPLQSVMAGARIERPVAVTILLGAVGDLPPRPPCR
jgi:hypothetical protein